MARRKTVLPSIASIFEQFVRITFVMLLLVSLKAKDIKTACFYVLLADVIAETVAAPIEDKVNGVENMLYMSSSSSSAGKFSTLPFAPKYFGP